MSEKFYFKEKILDKNECDIIKNYILKNEDRIKSLGSDNYPGTKENSLTGRYNVFNYLYVDEIGTILKPKLQKIFAELKLQHPISVQCWANTFRRDEGISVHKHGPNNVSFVCTNLFIDGPTDIGTTYYINNEFVNYQNIPGEIHVFGSNLYHYVSDNKTDITRVSLSMDILEKLDDKDKKRHFVIAKEQINKIKEPKGFK
jgi:hypothetical protein